MHIVYHNAITRDYDIAAAISNRGWIGHEIKFESFNKDIEELERQLFKSCVDALPMMCFATIPIYLRSTRSNNYPQLRRGMIVAENILNWSDYATALPDDMLLNGQGVMLPWKHLSHPSTKAMLQNLYPDGMFLRPNPPFKAFTGFPVYWPVYDSEIRSYQSLSSIKTEEVAVCLPLQSMDHVEWRFWVVAGEIITQALYSCQWLDDTAGVKRPKDPPSDIVAAAQRAVDHLCYHADSFVIDLVKTPGGIKVVEINGLSTSGIYDGMDLDALLASLPNMFG